MERINKLVARIKGKNLQPFTLIKAPFTFINCSPVIYVNCLQQKFCMTLECFMIPLRTGELLIWFLPHL